MAQGDEEGEGRSYRPERTTPPQTTQSKVYDYIKTHPGIHLRKIGRELGLATGDVQYHLYKLENQGRVNSSRRGLYKLFYPSDLFGETQKKLLGVLSQETAREVLLNVIQNPNTSQEELALILQVSQPTISWHIKRLVELGILQKEQKGRTVAYQVLGNTAEILIFMENYHPSAWEKWSSRLADMVLALSGDEGKEY
ncbi:MAG: winged helix-turn-helix transcriptional regulator [Thaumarchaeota archaeon]|nr:winged helix-turn-helix transcriptional regulator [Nitrososphaerota archaeon]